ncbi:MAG: hypothetical protein ACREX0_00935 [Noviherbaspirillum sp.]
MKRLLSIALLTASTLMSACSFLPIGAASSSTAERAAASKQARNADLPADQVRIQDEAGSAVVQKVEFKSGVSSASVERLAKSLGCTGRAGAGLVTEKGPVEVYRMPCDNGTTFMAQCELRQCRPLR